MPRRLRKVRPTKVLICFSNGRSSKNGDLRKNTRNNRCMSGPSFRWEKGISARFLATWNTRRLALETIRTVVTAFVHEHLPRGTFKVFERLADRMNVHNRKILTAIAKLSLIKALWRHTGSKRCFCWKTQESEMVKVKFPERVGKVETGVHALRQDGFPVSWNTDDGESMNADDAT